MTTPMIPIVPCDTPFCDGKFVIQMVAGAKGDSWCWNWMWGSYGHVSKCCQFKTLEDAVAQLNELHAEFYKDVKRKYTPLLRIAKLRQCTKSESDAHDANDCRD